MNFFIPFSNSFGWIGLLYLKIQWPYISERNRHISRKWNIIFNNPEAIIPFKVLVYKSTLLNPICNAMRDSPSNRLNVFSIWKVHCFSNCFGIAYSFIIYCRKKCSIIAIITYFVLLFCMTSNYCPQKNWLEQALINPEILSR